MKNWLALDIGGANVKVADGRGYAVSHPFTLWSRSQELTRELRTYIAEAPLSDHLAVTMTGELADCFESKTAGVRHILQAVAQAADGRHTRVYLSDGKLVTPQVAANKAPLAAAANWHVLSRFAASRYARRGGALLIDVGSTTTDLIPLQDGQPAARGQTDTQRLIQGELVYTGVIRSPLCALLQIAPYREARCRLAQEVFATMYDAYLVLGDLAEDATGAQTADGRPAGKGAARRRLGRMLCADEAEFNHRDAVALAQAAAAAQAALVQESLRQVLGRSSEPPQTVILSGQGEFLARRVIEQAGLSAKVVSLAKELGAAISQCAPAHALATLTLESLT